MAAVRSMISVAREEVAILSTELAPSTRTSALEGIGMAARSTEMEALNPIGIRQAAEATIKQPLGGNAFSFASSSANSFCFRESLTWIFG